MSTQKPMRSVMRSQSPIWRMTDSRHRRVNSSTPTSRSIRDLSKIPSSFSISCSTGRPCVSQPARRGQW